MAWLSQGRSLWRLVSEIDMSAIQVDAERPFTVGIVGVSSEQAVQVAAENERRLQGDLTAAESARARLAELEPRLGPLPALRAEMAALATIEDDRTLEGKVARKPGRRRAQGKTAPRAVKAKAAGKKRRRRKVAASENPA